MNGGLAARVNDVYSRWAGQDPVDHTHVFVVVDVDHLPHHSPSECANANAVVLRLLEEHLPVVDAVGVVATNRYGLVARRHPGLALALSALESELDLELAGSGTSTAIWCEELPDDGADVPALLRGAALKHRPSLRQLDRSELAGAARFTPSAPHALPARPASAPVGRPVASVFLVAAMVLLLLASTAVMGARYTPWRGTLGPASHDEAAGPGTAPTEDAIPLRLRLAPWMGVQQESGEQAPEAMAAAEPADEPEAPAAPTTMAPAIEVPASAPPAGGSAPAGLGAVPVPPAIQPPPEEEPPPPLVPLLDPVLDPLVDPLLPLLGLGD